MTQRRALMLATGLTAFVLVILGAVLGGPTRARAMAPAAGTDSALAAQLQDWEAAYRQRLDQANSQLQQAYDQIARLQGGSSAPSTAVATYPVSADLAAGLAVSLAPGAKLLRWPTLVDFQGTVAYEIILDRGAVYIDATTGQLLFSGVNTVSGGMLAGTFEGEHEDDD